MATASPEVELLKPGMKTNQIDLGVGWIQNLYFKDGAWTLRPGFGQLTQIDSTLTAGTQNNETLDGQEIGYSEHLGSHYLFTDFGHEQIVSVFRGVALSGNSDGTAELSSRSDTEASGTQSVINTFYFVDIYDITTDTHWEEVLHSKTAQAQGNAFYPMNKRRGCYSTTSQRDLQSWISAATNRPFFFLEFQDIVYFGNKDAGLFGYVPCIFKRRRKQQVETFFGNNAADDCYSESCRVINVYFVDGINAPEGWDYLSQSQVGKPTDIALLGDHMAFALDREILFSDIAHPNSIKEENTQFVPAEKTITAIQSINDKLMVFTESETFLLVPSVTTEEGGLINIRQIKLDEGVGCLSPNSITKVGNSLVWVDRNGVYKSNGVSIEKISTDINNLFTDYLTNPLTKYYVGEGALTEADIPSTLRHNYDITTERNINVSYDVTNDLVFVSIPEQNYVLVYKNGWSIWTFDSMLQGAAGGEGSGSVGAVNENIQNPWLLPTDKKVYLVGSMDQVVCTNKTLPGGTDGSGVLTGQVFTNQSYYICEWGVGGALDRTSNKLPSNGTAEDRRKFVGEWETLTSSASRWADIIFEKPFRVPNATQVYKIGTTPTGTGGLALVGTPQPTFVLPISIMWAPLSSLTNLNQYNPMSWTLDFKFDNDHYTPWIAFGGGTGELIYYLPNDRRWTADELYGGTAYDLAAMAVGQECRLYTNAGAATSTITDGNRIKIGGDIGNSTTADEFRTTGGTGLNEGLNITPGRRRVMIYVPFTRQAADTDKNAWNLGITSASGTFAFKDAAAATQTQTTNIYAWKSAANLGFQNPVVNAATTPVYFNDENLKTQPVDWCYKAEQVGLAEAEQVRARGLYALIKSTGVGATGFISNTWYGIFNTLLGSDWKGWTSQICDYKATGSTGSPIPKDLDKINARNPIRTRTRNTQETLKKRIFADEGTTADNPAHWNTEYLIDDQELDVLATSDSVKGKSISYMFFGFANNIAEKLRIGSVKAAIRKAGGRRRTGRSG